MKFKLDPAQVDSLHLLLIQKLGGRVVLTPHDVANLSTKATFKAYETSDPAAFVMEVEKPPVIIEGTCRVVEVRDVVPA